MINLTRPKGRNAMTLDLKSFAAKVRVTDGAYWTPLQENGLLGPGSCPDHVRVIRGAVNES